MRVRRTVLSTLFALVLAAPMWAQTYTAASCGESDIAAAIAAEQRSPADGDVILIPAGTSTWTGTVNLTARFTTSVTIQGAGAESATTGGAASTGTDRTIIVDHLTHGDQGGPSTTISLDAVAGKSLRITGIALLMDPATHAPWNGMLQITGDSTAVRIDHCHVNVEGGMVGIRFDGSETGVIDHVLFTSPPDALTNDIAFHNGQWWTGDQLGEGDASWADGDHFGSDRFFFVEDCRFANGDPGDGGGGARFVLRYNTAVSDTVGHPQMYTHGLTSARGRGFRAAELYHNTFIQPGPTGGGNVAFNLNSGTALFWGNTVTYYRHAVAIDYTRKSDMTYPYAPVPNGWGHCDGVSVWTAWDGPASALGYPAIDQPGRGAGDMLSGVFPNVVNARTGTSASPRQALSPIYLWGNAYTPAGGFSDAGLVSEQCALAIDNRDYFQQFGPQAESGAFDGTRGVGEGTLAQRPATGKPYVAYWATDMQTLYQCTASGAWAPYYAPYPYPHPLAGGSQPPPGNQPPTVVLTSPADNATAVAPASFSLTATANDSDGSITKVEFYQGATLLATDTSAPYAFTWSGVGVGAYALTAKAYDDQGAATTSATANVTVTATPPAPATSLWDPSAVPAHPSDPDGAAVEVGVKIRSDVAGSITGLRFYKGAGNTGTHTGHVWSRSGALLGSLTFSSESAGGWQQASFANAIAIQAGTTYIASYHTDVGHYAADNGFFAGNGVDRAPLHALADGVDGGDGVYRYGASAFPTETSQATNYWVDVVFAPEDGGGTTGATAGGGTTNGGASTSGGSASGGSTASGSGSAGHAGCGHGGSFGVAVSALALVASRFPRSRRRQ